MSAYNELPDNFLRGSYWRDKPAPRPDFEVNDHGSIVILQPMTEAAEQWVKAHLPSDAQRWGTGVAIEPRYLLDITDGITSDGLLVRFN